MTLPEHAVCSLMLAQATVRPRYGWRGVAIVVLAGIVPDVDVVTKLAGDEHYWRLHHALGHGLPSIIVLALAVSVLGRFAFGSRPFAPLFGWCLIAAFVHVLTDSLYWFAVQPGWPFHDVQIKFELLEYLDLVVLAIWFGAAVCLYGFPDRGRLVASASLSLFVGYVALRAALPAPTGFFKLVTGGWMYAFPQDTPVLDWW